MNLLIIIVVMVLLAVLCVGAYLKLKSDHLPDDHDLVASLDKIINKGFKAPREHGLVIGVYKDDRIYSQSYGVVSHESGLLPDAQTTFQIGSITKVFTASLLQVLSDRHLVSLESTLGELIGDDVAMNDDVAKITLMQLATHTSGFPRVPRSMMKKIEKVAGKKNVMDDPYSYLDVETVFAYLKGAQGTKASGKFAYSNFGMGLLGHVLEKVTNESLEDLFIKEIFAPLGMANTGMTLTPAVEQNFAQGYDAKGDAIGIWQFKSLGAAGAVNSTMSDMLKFVQASVESGSAANHRLENMRLPLYSGNTGLGWMQPGLIEKLHGNRSSVWHNGMTGGYSSYLSIDLVNKSGVVVLTGRAVDATMLGVLISRQVRTQSWA